MLTSINGLTIPLACFHTISRIHLDNVNSEKLLGVVIQNDLSWSEHINMVCKKIKSKLYLLHQIKAFLPCTARKQFFNSFILLHFDYVCQSGDVVVQMI